MGAAFLPGVERESDSIQPGLIFLYYGGSRSRRRDPIRKKVKHCVNIISTLLLLFLPSPLLTAAVQGKGIVSIISVIGEREEEREEGGSFFFYFAARDLILTDDLESPLSSLLFAE